MQTESLIETLSKEYIPKLKGGVYPADIGIFRECYEKLSQEPMDKDTIEIIDTNIRTLRIMVCTQEKYIRLAKSRKLVEEGIELLEEIVGSIK